MDFGLQPKYITCKIDIEKLFHSIVNLLRTFYNEEFDEKNFTLSQNEDLGIYEVKYLGSNMQDNIKKNNIIKTVFAIADEQDLTNSILKRFFNIQEGNGCIQFHYDYFDIDNYYYIVMPYETFNNL